MQVARDRQKVYADLKHKPMEFQVEDKVMLKVLPWKRVVRFGKRRKLNPRYVGPLKEWMKDKEDVKHCPVCRFLIEKIDGCNHIEYKCGVHICWVCVVHFKTSEECYTHLRMQAARDRQKSNADLKRKPMEFQVGDKVMLKVSPWKGVVHFGKRGKLNPRYVGPFKVLEKVGEVAYKLELPEELSRVHNIFHVSNLKKCYADELLAVPLDGLHFDDKLQFVKEPVEIMDCEVKRLKRSRIPLIKV
ncbi:hypothetical protein Tco_0781443 [Tanacetum coccineum]